MPGRIGLLALLSGRVSVEPYVNFAVRPTVQSQLANSHPRDITVENCGPRKSRSTLRLIRPQNKNKTRPENKATECTISPILLETLEIPDVEKEQPSPPPYSLKTNQDQTIDVTENSFSDTLDAFNSRGHLSERKRSHSWSHGTCSRSARESSADGRIFNGGCAYKLSPIAYQRSRSELEQRRRMFRALLNRYGPERELDVNAAVRRWRASRLLLPTSRIGVRNPPHSILSLNKIYQPVDLSLRRNGIARIRHYS